MIKKLLLSLLLAVPCYAEQVASTQFKGLKANENAVIIGPEFAQDLLNIDVSNSGKSVKKRPGYGLYKTLSTSQALHGGYHFFDSSGNDVQVWASSTSVYGIVADAAPTQLVSSMTLNSTMDCADTQGSAYCVTSNRDFYIKTNGTSLQNWATSPLGTMVEATPDRVVVAGVSGNLSTIYHSASNSFFNYTPGPLATDAFTEVIAAPGSKITHLRYACGKLLWWKDQSFGYEAFDDQYSLQIKIISDNIGTFDNTSAVDPGGNVWFRGQDGHIWQYDCSGLIKQSLEITPFVQASGRRTSNLWTQTSQSDWQTGSSSPTVPAQPLSFTISAGDVVPGSYTVTENSSSQWNSGTASNVTINASSIQLATNNSGNVTNNDFESGTLGSGAPTNWTNTAVAVYTKMDSANSLTTCRDVYSGITGSFFAEPGTGQKVSSTPLLVAKVLDARTGSTLDSSSFSIATKNCAFTSRTLTVSASNIGKRVQFVFQSTDSDGTTDDATLKTSESYILGGNVTFNLAIADNGGTAVFAALDNVQNGSSTITTGSFTSQALNTALPYGYIYPTATWTSNTSTPSFVLQQATSTTGGWSDITTSTNVNVQTNKRYLRYLSTFTITASDTALSTLSSVSIVERASGTYFSQVKAAPSLAAYSTFNPTYSNGNGSHAFYVRVNGGPFLTLASTIPWTSQTPNSIIAATWTATYIQFADSFTITSATDTVPTLNDFTVNWFEGNATDQAYLAYFDNAIWSDVSYGAGVSSNTYIFKYDLINEGWTLYNFGAGGMLVQNNRLYFGDVGATGKIYQFNSGHSDAGNPIVAYWKSKEFTGPDPFLQGSLGQIDVFAKKDQGSTLTSTYALDTSTTTTSYSISLSSPIATFVQSRKLVPPGKTGYTWNLKLGDSSDSSDWELFGFRIVYTQNPYRPTP